MNDNRSIRPPRVSIITPSFNQGAYLRATLDSVLNQAYPAIELIVVDGGSTDDSVPILKAYAQTHPGRLTWRSAPDRGQADAINKGLRQASGDILAYLNSDDTYALDAVEAAVAALQRWPRVGLVHGRGLHIDAAGRPLDPYPSEPCDDQRLARYCSICQPTAFWRRRVYETVGEFDASLHYGLDYDYWIRASRHFAFGFIDRHLANTRLHADAKTVGQRHRMHREIVGIVRSHYGRVSDHWIYAYAHSFPSVDRLRAAGRPAFIPYLIWFSIVSGCLFMKHNRRIPWRAARLLVQSLGTPRNKGIIS
jgi:glycosyltransferase involved in cell wall biosynthesis